MNKINQKPYNVCRFCGQIMYCDDVDRGKKFTEYYFECGNCNTHMIVFKRNKTNTVLYPIHQYNHDEDKTREVNIPDPLIDKLL